MAARQRRNPQRKKKKRNSVFGPLMFFIICAVLIFGMSVFFRVSRIEVVGNSLYTAEEIIAAAGVEEGDNLFFFNRSSAVSRIYSRLAYIESAYITRYLPNGVVIEVSESSAIAYVAITNDAEATPTPEPTPEPTEGGEGGEDTAPGTSVTWSNTTYWIIDRNCKLLKEADTVEVVGLIELRGLTPIRPEVGAVIAPGEAEKGKVSYAAEILWQIQERGMQNDVTWLDITAASNPSFDYLGRFTVKMGAIGNTDHKFGVLLAAVDMLAAGDRGTIDLSDETKANFSPE